MITRPTVLILGAGASSAYDFPIGNGLVSKIISNLRPLSKNETRGSNDWVPFLINEFGLTEQEIYDFQEYLKYSRISIDLFLEYRPEFLRIGKLAIALGLISSELESKLFNASRNWLDYLRNKLIAPFNEFGENKLSIITFNYDRSLEQYLFKVLKNTYGKSDDECAKQIEKIPIIHVHGRLGALPWQDAKGRPYEGTINHESVKLASEQIIIMSEGQDTSPQFQKAFELMKDAIINKGYIYFLGFGYNEISLKRLKLEKIEKYKKVSPFAYGTGYELPRADSRRIGDKWPISIGHNKWDVLTFLQEIPRLE